jgi:hypothetical protein
MKTRSLWMMVVILVALALPTLACSITFNLPDRVETTTTRTFDVSESAPTGDETTKIYIEMGAGELEVSGGASQLIEGSVRYNVADWQPSITRTTDQIEIIQGSDRSYSLSANDVINEWNLQLGNFPIDLEVQAGAYKGTLDLSGVPIKNLTVSDGASKGTINFDTLNPVAMDRLTYKTGASQVDLEGLGNANAREIVFEGGAGSYTLDFSGDLQQDLSVKLSAGMSNVRIEVPEDASIEVIVGGGLSNVSVSGTWTTTGDSYERLGSGPKITLTVSMGLGNLELRVR